MRRSGFTLLELVLVMAVIIALTAIVYPSFEPMYRQYRVSAGADAFKGALLTARAQAVQEGRPYAVRIVAGKGNFRIAPADQAYWSGASAPPDPESGVGHYIREDALPTGVTFLPEGQATPGDDDDGDSILSAEEVGNRWQPFAVFLPDGSAQEDKEITLFRSGTRPFLVTLRSLTGNVTTRRAPLDQTGGP